MEALNVLRIEKGFITHAEIDGRRTAFDIGAARMISAKKDCMGKTMAARPGLVDELRPQMVGIKPVEAGATLSAGAHLYETDAAQVNGNGLGHVTSVGYSPDLGRQIGIAFVVGGEARHGDVVRFVDAVRGLETDVEVCAPVFVDPEGGRVRG
jgi:glycine cleavage system aminomethyltransferase T